MSADRSVWLAERRKSIGGSDAAAIVSLSDYASPYSVWAEKTGRVPERPDNEAMREGRDLEQYVAQRWMEATGKRCRRRTAMLRNVDYPFAHANIDRWVVGENAGLECKTVKPYDMRRYEAGEYPDRFYVQCVHYMAVTRAARWYLAVLVLGSGFYTFTIERDEGEISALMEAERAFWRYVEEDTPPPADGTQATAEALQVIYRDGGRTDTADLFGLDHSLDLYFQAKAGIRELQGTCRSVENEIKAAMGDRETGVCDRAAVSWKTQTRRSLDIKRLQEDYPELDLSGYYQQSSSRVFRIKELK